MLDLNRPSQPRLSDLPGIAEWRAIAHSEGGGRTMGRDGRLRVAPVAETPLHQPPQAGTRIFASLARCRRERRRASQRSSQRRGVPYSSQRPLVGTRTVTDKIFYFQTRRQHIFILPRSSAGLKDKITTGQSAIQLS